jgi:hypothetical protein
VTKIKHLRWKIFVSWLKEEDNCCGSCMGIIIAIMIGSALVYNFVYYLHDKEPTDIQEFIDERGQN